MNFNFDSKFYMFLTIVDARYLTFEQLNIQIFGCWMVKDVWARNKIILC